MSTQAATRAPEQRTGCVSGLWLMFKLPFLFLRALPWMGEIIRREAATTTGERAQASYEQLTPAANPAAVTAVLAAIRSRDAGFDLDATTRGVVRARAAVNQARQSGDASAARLIMSNGLWSVFAMLLDQGAARGVHREEKSAVASARVVAATRDQLAEQLRIRLACQGERCERIEQQVVRGEPGEQTTWDEDWIIRRSAVATTPANGGVLSGRCPQCGADLDIDAGGACTYCQALVLTGGQDWIVWSIEEEPW
jgi:Tim44-like domain